MKKKPFNKKFSRPLITLLVFFVSQIAILPAQCLAVEGRFEQVFCASAPSSEGGSVQVAAAGPDQLADEKTRVFLDASNSWPLDTSTTSILWKQLAGPPACLSNPEDVRPFFIAPEVGPDGAALVFELSLTSNDITVKDTCIVNVSWGNIQPEAQAGKDLMVRQGENVFLDGSGSLDPDGPRNELRYLWRQTSGPHVVLSDATAVKASFVAPHSLHAAETLTFELVVTDKGGLKASDATIVNVASEQVLLQADAGPDGIVDEGRRIGLDASKSLSQPGKIRKYFWTQLQGPPVTLSNPASINPTFLTPSVKNFETADLLFRLTITNASGLMSSKKKRIRVDDNWLTSISPEAFAVPLKNKSIGFAVEKGGRLVDLSPAGLKVHGRKIPYGLFDLKIRTYRPGGEAALKIYFPQAVPAGYHWFKCGKQDCKTPVALPAVVNPERTIFTISLRDGDATDEDGLRNSMIHDPSGLGGPFIFLAQGGGHHDRQETAGSDSGAPPVGRPEGSAAFDVNNILASLFHQFAALAGATGSRFPESGALAASSQDWEWLSMQFGPAIPLLLLGLFTCISAILIKKTIRALLSSKDTP